MKQLTSESTLGDEGQVSGDFPNQPHLKAKFHTLHFQDAKEVLNALLEQSTRFETLITEDMTLKNDGSCCVLRKVILEDGTSQLKLVFPGSGIEIELDFTKRVESLRKSIEKY